jgi:multidrug efflux pump subunit AcrA (membrane-fusion protein)
MTASVKFETIPHNEKNKNITLVPIEAVWSDSSNKSYVWVIPDNGGLPQKTSVILGRMRNNGVEILSGLTPGKKVAVAGIHSLQENAPVRAIPRCKWGLDG